CSWCVFVFVFFFSSRRRHTRCLSDWSSDVCSSDLGAATPLAGLWLAQALQGLGEAAEAALQARQAAAWVNDRAQHAVPPGFRDSFLQRNPVHAALLAWAA